MAASNLFRSVAQAPDDRGAVVPLLNSRELKRSGDPARVALGRQLEAAVRAEARRTTLPSLVMGLSFVALWIAAQLLLLRYLPLSLSWLRTVLFWGGLLGIAMLSRGLARRRFARGLAATAVAQGFCGSCGYSLQALAAQADGCLLCPECGAAWRGLRVTRPHWDAAMARPLAGPPWWRRFLTGTPSGAQRLAPDDRGRYVPMSDSRLWALSAQRRRELGPTRLREIRRTTRRIGRLGRLLVTVPLVLITGLCVWIVASVGEMTLLEAGLPALVGAVILIAAAGLVLSHRFIPPARVGAVLRDHGLCGSCGASIAELPVEADGCATCSACGAGWRRSPPMTPEVSTLR
jgi:hypothetical protein